MGKACYHKSTAAVLQMTVQVCAEEERTSRCNSESRLSYVSNLTMPCSEFTHSLTGYESGPSGRNVAVYGRE